MKVQLLLSSLIIIILAQILSLNIAVPVTLDAVPAMSSQVAVSDVTSGQAPAADTLARRQIEERILKATVRIYIETWVVNPDESGYELDTAASHATLKGGRFLVTHNHFSAPITGGSRDKELGYIGVTLANSDGEPLFKGPLSDFELVWEDPETLIIAHKDDSLFEKLGFASAEFADWSSAPLEPGSEVAQVDWDGTTTRVDWTTVQEINVNEGVPRLVLADSITLGASGGGIFWQGKHIANNWLLVQELGASDELLGATTKVALNSAPVANGPSPVIASK